MTLVVQNDAGTVDGANALIPLATFAAYHDARGVDLSSYTDTEQEAAIVKATDYLGARWTFSGEAVTTDTAFPRSWCTDFAGYPVSGIPVAVQKAVAEYAYQALLGDLWADPRAGDDGRVIQSKTEKVGPIEETTVYAASGGTSRPPAFPLADNYLIRAGLVASGGQIVRA